MNMVTSEQLTAFVGRCQQVVDAYMAKQFPNNPRPVLSVDPGAKKFARIVSGDGVQRSAWAFVDLTNGDVLKTDGWKRPAKHARGNIYDANGGVGSIGPYGPAYLK